MYDFIARWAQLEPERVAIEEVRTGRTWTYGRLNERAERLASGWRSGLELPPKASVAVLCEGRGEVFEALFAAAKAELMLVPLNWRLAPRELRHIVDDARAQVVVYDDAHAETAAHLLADSGRIGLSLGASIQDGHRSWEDLVQAASIPRSRRQVALEDVPLVLYTSGTTGGPKGVMVPWRQIVFNAINTVIAADLTPDDVTLACLPLFHTGGLHALATPTLYRGGRVMLSPGFDAEEAAHLVGTGRATTTIAVPTMYEMMADAGLLGAKSGPGPRILLCGGAPLTDHLGQMYHEAGLQLRQGYGLTEVGPNCFTLSPASGPDRIGTVGHPAFHSRARLVDAEGNDAEPGTPGELWLHGPHVTKGYLHNPVATAAALGEDGWFRTADLLTQNERGVYRVVGRLKDMFISGGENVYPAEIENLLVEHPDVLAAAVVGVPDPKWGQVGLAAVIARDPKAPPGQAALTEWMRARLARYKVPKHWRLLSSFPLNATGKVQKNVLQERFEQEFDASKRGDA